MKKTMQLSMLMLAITAITVFNSCKKDSIDDDAGKTKIELLTSGKWHLTGATLQGADYYPYLQQCLKDNIYMFNADGTGSFDEGPSKCDVDDEQSYTFAWSLTNNESKITFDDETHTLTQLTSTTLKVTVVEQDGGSSVTSVETFSH